MNDMHITEITSSDFILISAVNNEIILEDCLKRSDDVTTGRLKLLAVRDAKTMADAYNRGLAQSEAAICLFAHQDVYLPKGWLDRAVSRLNALTRAHPDWRVAGPYGVKADGEHVGRVWDVTMGRELGGGGL